MLCTAAHKILTTEHIKQCVHARSSIYIRIRSHHDGLYLARNSEETLEDSIRKIRV